MSSRQKRFKEDVSSGIELCKKYSWPFDSFEETETSVTFTIEKESTVHPFSICISDDYPENSLITRPDQPNQSQLSHKTLPVIFQSLHKELFGDSHTEEGQMLQVPTTSRSISVESNDSYYADCQSNLNSDDEEDMEEDYYNEDEEMEGNIDINSALDADMYKLTSCYGEDTLSYRLLDTIDEIDIEINLNLSNLLEKEIAEAWKLNREEPLVVRLHLSMASYLDTPLPPRVEAFQPSKKDCGALNQLKKILEMFVHHQWSRISNEQVQLIHEQRERAKVQNATEFSKRSITVDDKDLAQLMEMGFSTEMARNALMLNHGSLDNAIDDLMNSGERKYNFDETFEPNPVPKHPPKPRRQHSHPPVMKKIKKSFIRQKSVMATASAGTGKVQPSKSSGDEEASSVPSSSLFIQNPKQVPEFKSGFLVQIYDYIRQRLPKLNEYCVVCDEPHVFQNGAMLKPAVCSRELCVFAFQTLGVMADAAEDIATGAEVVDLLVAMTKAACSSSRKKVIFDPYPTVVDPSNPKELSINPKNKNYDHVQRILDLIPPVKEMTRIGGSSIKRNLDEKDAVAYPLLQWIITSNRSHIVKLPTKKQITFMRTPHQFLLLSSPPAKEATFRDEKNKYGSTFAFHGSSIENWHSIIREGLVVASGTNKQVNGAAYGKGIYLSPCASVSFGYSRMGYGSHTNKKTPSKAEDRFLSSNNISCIALCEVITSPQLKKSGTIWVCPNPDHVCTRFFFVYEDGQVGDNDINTEVNKYSSEIRCAVGYRT